MFMSTAAVLLSIVIPTSAAPGTNEARVRSFVKAFNERNIDAMLERISRVYYFPVER
jgi:hypothetical protein